MLRVSYELTPGATLLIKKFSAEGLHLLRSSPERLLSQFSKRASARCAGHGALAKLKDEKRDA